MEALEKLTLAAKALNDKKAIELGAVKVTDLTVIADYFLFATATSSTHVRALADAAEEALSKVGMEPHHIEGRATGWILLDYSDLIVHVFSKQAREFYSLDKTWSDGQQVDLSDILGAEDK